MATNDPGRALRRDVRFLGGLLGEVIAEQEGADVLALEERIRKLAIERRRGPKAGRAAAEKELVELLHGLPVERVEPVIRAFAAYFQLTNIAEQQHRIRRTRTHEREKDAPLQRGSLAAAFAQAKAAGVTAEKAREAVNSLQVILAFTAHPTQATRRTVLEKLYRIAAKLDERDRCTLTPREESEGAETIREEIAALWQTDELRHERPSVGDEVKNVLWYLEEMVRPLAGELPERLAWAFERAYGEPLGEVATPLRLHSWVGGDMDGNPRVTPDVFEDALRAHHVRGLRKLVDDVRSLGSALAASERHVPVPQELLDSIAADEAKMPSVSERLGPRTQGEPWRRKLSFVEARLEATRRLVESRRAGRAFAEGFPYANPAEFLAELDLVARTMAAAKGRRAGLRRVLRVREQVRAMGFHSAELELRTRAEDAQDAAAFVAGKAPLGEGGARLMETLRRLKQAQREGGEQACRTFILSMASSSSDVLAAFAAARAAGLWDAGRGCATIDIAPLFETLDALDSSVRILRELFADPAYSKHVSARGVQEVMVGYSDSGKEVGLLAASGALRRAQSRLPEVAKEAGVRIRLFHGRGESVARGGGPAQQAILALPRGAVGGMYKATEQGEAMDQKWGVPAIAARTLELVVGGALLHSLDAQKQVSPADEARYGAAYDELAEAGRKAYRALVWENALFLEYFQTASPLEELGRLNIGSRPAKRSLGGLESLRAIPWVFAWTQNRAILPGWYGVGSALEAFAASDERKALLFEMYSRWPFFRSVLDNVAMVLAKADPGIAARYAELAPKAARDAVWPAIAEEFVRTRKWVKRLADEEKLLDRNPTLQRSIALRNPYVDPMSLLQVELLRRRRAGDPGVDRSLLLSINGIAAGMRNTG